MEQGSLIMEMHDGILMRKVMIKTEIDSALLETRVSHYWSESKVGV